MLFCTLVLCILATSQAWLIETNINEITPGGSRDVVLVCKQDNSNGTRPALNTITRIRITKRDPFGSKMTFEEIRAQTNMTSNKYNNYTVEGRVDKIEDAFLKVTWPLATKDTAGAYGCEIDGFDSLSNFVSLKVNPKEIREKLLTMDEVNKLIHLATSSYEKKQRDLELEIVALKSLFVNNLQSINRQIEDQSKRFESEIAKARNMAKVEYSTKDELSEGLSTLKNTTRTELISDNQQDQKEHRVLLNAIQNMNKTSCESFAKITSEFTKTTIALGRKIDRLDHKKENSIEQINSTLKDIDTMINSTVAKLGNRIDSLKNELEKQISEATCPCPTTASTTTPTTPKVDLLKWPDGAYKLVRPASGCPALRYKTELKFLSTSTIPEYIIVKVNSPSGAVDLSYCQHDEPPSSSSSNWPKGSYCVVVKTNQTCPQGFSEGLLHFFAKKYFPKKTISFEDQYCCKSDGTATSPMRLPRGKPFYLYRYKGVCQAVKGMRVRQDTITVAKKKQHFSLYKGVKKTGAGPDISTSTERTNTIYLCYYSTLS